MNGQAAETLADAQGHTLVCDRDLVLTAYFRYEVELVPRRGGVTQPSAGVITAPTPSFT
jgi:hypothetical protein